jgi:hypothetical protein
MTGPNLSLLVEAHRQKTMADAVGTCGNNWVSGGAVVVRGTAWPVPGSGDHASVHVDVERVEEKISVDTWLSLAPRYRHAVDAVATSVTRRRTVSAEDFAPLARVHEQLRKTYGESASLLEVEAVLRNLARAFRSGSPEMARHALEIRCRRTTEEETLYAALSF